MRDSAGSTCLCSSLVRSSSRAQRGTKWHRQHTPSQAGQCSLADARWVECLLARYCMWPEAWCCLEELTNPGLMTPESQATLHAGKTGWHLFRVPLGKAHAWSTRLRSC